MRRTCRVIILFILILGSMAGLWIFQSWQESRNRSEKETVKNVYITNSTDDGVTALCRGERKTWGTASPVTGQAVTGVADLYLEDGAIVKIVTKPEYITGKVLSMDEEKIVLDEYGGVDLDQGCEIYKIAKNGEVSQGSEKDIMVGYSNVQFVVGGREICAVVVTETRLDTIRVLLKNNEGTSYDIQRIDVTATADFNIKEGKQMRFYKKGEKVTVEASGLSGRMIISPGDNGKIRIENLKRQCGVPEYRGTLEIRKSGSAMHLINELPLEEYLYSVVPSEMPSEYPAEALKAQAVCARSYAVQQIQGKRLSRYGAHVDDSVSFQVYNNLREDKKSIEAVQATAGEVVSYQNKVAATYFFSSSGGSTSGTKDVWFTKKDTAYLTPRIQTWEDTKTDLSQEKNFCRFIDDAPKTIDSESPWYRWETSLSAADIQKSIERSLAGRYAANPTQIQVKQPNGKYKSQEIASVGAVQDIRICERGAGGVARALEIQGEKASIKVYSEYNIRTLLAGEKTVFTRKDKKKVTGLSLLPSGFFYIEKKGDSYVLRGGGYGHGVGMSQYGASALAKEGKKYTEILTFYFAGTSVVSRESL